MSYPLLKYCVLSVHRLYTPYGCKTAARTHAIYTTGFYLCISVTVASLLLKVFRKCMLAFIRNCLALNSS